MRLSNHISTVACLLSIAAALPSAPSNAQNVNEVATKAGPKWLGFIIETVVEKLERFFHHITWDKDGEDYLDWSNYTANGVNLGGWLVQEQVLDPTWFGTLAYGATDEWSLCEALGSKCGPAMEARYASFITTDTIDTLASSNINTLRIPTTYAAWIKVPGSQLYHGSQQVYLKKIAEYAISKYNMHIIIDLHNLPGGVNYLDIGEHVGNDGWFQNETNLEYSYQAVSQVLDFIQASAYPTYYTLEPINEAMDNVTGLFTENALTTAGAAWMLKYFNGVLDLIGKVNPKIPMMLMDSFAGETFWSPLFNASANIVIDRHIYYFAADNAYAQYVPATVCSQGAAASGDGKFPVFVGEWSLQTQFNNSFALRKTLFDTQRYAWAKYVHGGAFWTARFYGNVSVNGEGTQGDYWNYVGLMDENVITPATNASYC